MSSPGQQHQRRGWLKTPSNLASAKPWHTQHQPSIGKLLIEKIFDTNRVKIRTNWCTNLPTYGCRCLKCLRIWKWTKGCAPIIIIIIGSRNELLGNSCKIGNTRLLGTSKNQNHQLCEICHFCLIFTLQQYIVAQKLIRQPYCSFNQHFVACQRKFSVPRRRRQNIQRIWPGKSVHSAQIKCKRHHLMLKSISRSIYVLFFHFHLVHVPSNYVSRRSKS